MSLTPEQEESLLNREPDMRLCIHQVAVATDVDPDSGQMPESIAIKFMGHMVLPSDYTDEETGELKEPEDIPHEIPDHRLFVIESALWPWLYDAVIETLVEARSDWTRRAGEAQKRRGRPHGPIPPGDIARFLGSIPEIFLNRPDPRKRDDQ